MQGAPVTSRGGFQKTSGPLNVGLSGEVRTGAGMWYHQCRDRKQGRRIGDAIPGGRRRPDGTLVFF